MSDTTRPSRILTIPAVMSKDQCVSLIESVEDIGFEKQAFGHKEP